MKRIISCVMAICIVFALSLPVYAAKPSLTLSVKRYDSASNTYVKTNGEAVSGDLLLVELGISDTVASIGAMRLKLTYNSSRVDYVTDSEFLYITSGTPLVTNKISSDNPEQSYTVATLGADSQTPGTAIATNFKGTVISYLFRCTGSGNARFIASIEEIYDKNYNEISIDKKQTSFVTITKWQFADLPLFQVLSNISYPQSKSDIEAADAAYEKLSSGEQSTFKSNYPDEFNAYSTAWKRFYDLAEAAAEAEIKAEIDILLNSDDFAKIKNLNADQIDETNYESVVSSYNQYKKLSNAAKQSVSDSVKNLINTLYEPASKIAAKVKAQKSADEDAQLFISLYYSLKDLEDIAVRSGAENGLFLQQLRSATADLNALNFELMSSDVRQEMQAWKTQLEHYNELIEDELIRLGVSRELLEEVNDFTSKWSKVLRLNMLNVSISDETALELMIEDYEKLSDEAKKQLSPNYNTAKQLLQIIESQQQTNQGSDSNILNQTTSQLQPLPNSTEQSGGSDTVKVVENTKKVYVERGISPLVKIIALITLISVLSIFFPIGMQLFHQIKKQREEKE